ncbi:MAG: hypothetical protein ABEL97_06055 [Salinibacter sp.]
MDDSEVIIGLLRRLVAAAEQEEMGLIGEPPGRRIIYANRTNAPRGAYWYRWDRQRETPLPIEEEALRGILTDLFCYEKQSERGSSTKARAVLNCGRVTYEIETSLTATSGRGLVSGLLEAGGEALQRPITIGVRPADKEQVLFLDVYTDEDGKQYPDATVPSDREAALDAVRTVRRRLGREPDPWSDRFENGDGPAGREEPAPDPSQTRERSAAAPDHEGDAAPDETSSSRSAGDAPDSRSGDLGAAAGEASGVDEEARRQIESWNEQLTQIEDSDRLQKNIDYIKDKIASWPPSERRAARQMLRSHESQSFDSDDDLPF